MRRALAPLILLAAAPPAAPPIAPGLWEVTNAATNLEMPGVPRFLANLARRPTSAKRCITAEQAAHGPVQQLGNRQDCTISENRVAGGTIAVTALCPEKQGGQTRIHVEGRYTPTSYTTSGTIVGTGGKRGDMRIDFTESGRRIGDCPAGKQG